MNCKPDKKTGQVLEKLSEFIAVVDDKFFCAVIGGIAVDGYAGKFTRNHPDVDILVFRKDLKKLERVLEKSNYAFAYFDHPQEPRFKYKIQTCDSERTFTFQIIDKKSDNKFEISFYRDLHLIYPMNFITDFKKTPDFKSGDELKLICHPPLRETPLSGEDVIKPQNWLSLEGVCFPAVSKQFLVKLKENEVAFFEKLKKENPEKYILKRRDKHLNCLHDLRLLYTNYLDILEFDKTVKLKRVPFGAHKKALDENLSFFKSR